MTYSFVLTLLLRRNLDFTNVKKNKYLQTGNRAGLSARPSLPLRIPGLFISKNSVKLLQKWEGAPSCCIHIRLLVTEAKSAKHTSLWEANSTSDRQKIARILWNPKFYIPDYNSPLPLNIQSQINPIHTSPLYFLMCILILYYHLHFSICLPEVSQPKLCMHLFSLSLSLSLHQLYACALRISFLTPIIFGHGYKSWSSSLRSLLQSPVAATS